jgi:hypothetical protein
MKGLITTLTNTYKAIRLLGDPHIGAYLESQLMRTASKANASKIQAQSGEAAQFGTRNAFYHKHYIVHVVS